MSNSAFWDDLHGDLEDPVFRDDFVAAAEEIAETDAANSVSPEELRHRRNQFIAESSAELGDIDASEVADLLDEARRNA
ncbi:MAG: hypothetical protein QM714_17645 [Nocardioides sp.]|uniref:hypothetical protein n=1 Tax=Nocardioides sp. TaxID=35761 RepID=UPI0039E626B9